MTMLSTTEELALASHRLGKTATTLQDIAKAWYDANHPKPTDDEIAAKCIEMVRNPPAIEVVPFPKKPLGPY